MPCGYLSGKIPYLRCHVLPAPHSSDYNPGRSVGCVCSRHHEQDTGIGQSSLTWHKPFLTESPPKVKGGLRSKCQPRSPESAADGCVPAAPSRLVFLLSLPAASLCLADLSHDSGFHFTSPFGVATFRVLGVLM